jgi:hypothetical protein
MDTFVQWFNNFLLLWHGGVIPFFHLIRDVAQGDTHTPDIGRFDVFAAVGENCKSRLQTDNTPWTSVLAT